LGFEQKKGLTGRYSDDGRRGKGKKGEKRHPSPSLLKCREDSGKTISQKKREDAAREREEHWATSIFVLEALQDIEIGGRGKG